MLLDDVATYLETNSTRLTVGINLTKGHMPDSPSTVTTIYESGGLPAIHSFSTSGAVRSFEQPGIQVLTRSTDYQTARAVAEDVYTILDSVGNTLLPTATGIWYGSIDAAHSPADTGVDGNERHKISNNFTVRKTTG